MAYSTAHAQQEVSQWGAAPDLGSRSGSARSTPWRTCVEDAMVWHMMFTASLRSQCILVTLSPSPFCSFFLQGPQSASEAHHWG